jgi:type II secretory pathway component GspD/PulD (secretin)
LGYLFRSTAKIDNKSELLVFITPKIIKDAMSVR